MFKQMFYLTPKMLLKAFDKYPYILLRTTYGPCFAVNSKAGKMAFKRQKPNLNEKLAYCGYIPISFQEYISRKTGFY